MQFGKKCQRETGWMEAPAIRLHNVIQREPLLKVEGVAVLAASIAL